MEVLPAIDLLGGKVVRLSQGDYDRREVYGSDPAEQARLFAAAGAKWIHVVDLDAARSGKPANGEAILAIRHAMNGNIELGGGLRDEETIRSVLAAGVNRAIVGSAALKDWKWFERLLADSDLPPSLALGLDARDGRLASHGWTELTELKAADLARRVNGSTLAAIVYTDISRDGMLAGPNFSAMEELIAATDVPVIASGGISSLDDIAGCRRIGCAGAIVGKACYEGALDLSEALRVAQEAG